MHGCILVPGYISRRTFPDKVGAGDALPDAVVVPQVGVGHEGAVQAGAEVVEALGVFPTEVEELCGRVSRRGRGSIK